MKTADLIPLILLQLDSGDKYGLEITKNIETISNGKIIIKQPTLYTILKKLEKSRFISSYWEDSDIGGKRHYYKITNNGKAQVSTLPSFDVLIASILSQDDNEFESFTNEQEENLIQTKDEETSALTKTNIEEDIKKINETNKTVNSFVDGVEKHVSIFDVLPTSNEESKTDETHNPSILPTKEVFDSDSIDTATQTDINLSNSTFLKSEATKREEQFASNHDITKFTEKHIVTDEYKEKLQSIYSSNTKPTQNGTKISQPLSSDVKFVDYRDFKTNKDYITAKKTAKNLLFKTLSTSLYLALILIITAFITANTGKSPVYYFMLILGLIVAIFYPSIFALNIDKLRLKYEFQPFDLHIKKRLIIAISLEIIIIIASIVLNLCLGIKNMFIWSNFENFYSIILLSSTIFADLIFTYIFMKKVNKTN